MVNFSLGNFYFAPYMANDRVVFPEKEELKGAILIVEIAHKEIFRVSWHFTRQDGTRIVADNYAKRMRELRRRSRPLHAGAAGYSQRLRFVMLKHRLARVMSLRKIHKIPVKLCQYLSFAPSFGI